MMALLGAATASSAFLVGIALRAEHRERDEILVIVGLALGGVLFGGMVFRCLQALRPKYTWRFNLSPKIIVEGYADHEVPPRWPRLIAS